jgi:electron-transferring-flavoprotein dehydrogenase
VRAKHVIFAEGCRGNLGRELQTRFDLGDGADPPHYAIGLKEIWQIDPGRHSQGAIVHTLGWPLDGRTDGGGFVYHAGGDQVYVGFIVSLAYRNPHLSPYGEFQRWKLHPRIRRLLEGGKRLSFGARAIHKGGLASLPRLTVPGGLLIGCDAGFLNPAKVKGTHTAMKSGMLAAEAVAEALASGNDRGVTDFDDRVRGSWLHEELHAARNFSAGLSRFGRLGGAALAFAEHNLLRGRLPLTIRNPRPDYAGLEPLDRARPIDYPPPDGVVSFDRESSIYLSNTNHEEDQPCHLKLIDPDVPIARNLPTYGEPARLYCPAGVYEVERSGEGVAFRINAQNCIHCKTCEIKDPAQNIRWEPPEGGGGPNYSAM